MERDCTHLLVGAGMWASYHALQCRCRCGCMCHEGSAQGGRLELQHSDTPKHTLLTHLPLKITHLHPPTHHHHTHYTPLRTPAHQLPHTNTHTFPQPQKQTSLTKDVSLPGMMTAITEVEVSKEDKMRKIEESERIKHNMLLKKAGR